MLQALAESVSVSLYPFSDGVVEVVEHWHHPGVLKLPLAALVVEANLTHGDDAGGKAWVMPAAIQAIVPHLNSLGIQSPCSLQQLLTDKGVEHATPLLLVDHPSVVVSATHTPAAAFHRLFTTHGPALRHTIHVDDGLLTGERPPLFVYGTLKVLAALMLCWSCLCGGIQRI